MTSTLERRALLQQETKQTGRFTLRTPVLVETPNGHRLETRHLTGVAETAKDYIIIRPSIAYHSDGRAVRLTPGQAVYLPGSRRDVVAYHWTEEVEE